VSWRGAGRRDAIRQLLERLGVDPPRVAVEHNLTIIKRHRQAEAVVSEGDESRIVNFVGVDDGLRLWARKNL
jgi:thiamine biosynthesis protein ThiS